ncbi:hypothetical protein ACTID9_00040 [Brevibacillus fluminis]|uniref:hypothetical protein n=1 Tax=Brevibacillus fluminis TaxID=511487 RepID=UPI003F894821
MKPSKSSDELERLFLQTDVPKIDVKDQVLAKITERKKQREAEKVKKKIIVIVAACLVFGVTSAFAAIKVYELKNDKGEVVVQVNKVDQNPGLNHQKTFNEKISEIRESMKPDTAAIVYIASDNPQKIISRIQKPITSSDRAALQTELGTLLTVPAELQGSFVFQEGYVEHMVNYDYKKEEIYQEAERTKQDIIIKEMKVDKKVQRTGATYKNNKGAVRIDIDNFENIKYMSSEAGPDETVEKVQVHGQEAIYHVQKSSDTGQEYKYLEIFNEKANLLYTVSTSFTTVSKEDLLAIAAKLW